MRIRECKLSVKIEMQPTFWHTFRFSMTLPPSRRALLGLCTHRFKALAEADPRMDLLSRQNPALNVWKLDSDGYRQAYGPPRMDHLRFSTRALVEGLIAQCIIRPDEVPVLIHTLQEEAVVPAMQNRILESIFMEERVRDPRSVVRSAHVGRK